MDISQQLSGQKLFEMMDRSTILDKYNFHFLDDTTYWEHYLREFDAFQHPDIFFDRDILVPPSTTYSGIENLAFHLVEKDTGVVAAAFHSRVAENRSYFMRQSIVHPDHRRNGLYSTVTKRILKVAERVGALATHSFHAPSNNPILIAKLKLGFHACSLELDPSDGISLKMQYFHDDSLLEAFRFRCGSPNLSERLHSSSHGSLNHLETFFTRRLLTPATAVQVNGQLDE